MPHGLALRSARMAFAFMVAFALVSGPAGCTRKSKEPKQEAQEQTEFAPSVTIKNYVSAPDVELKALDGSSSRLSSHHGNIVILTFLAAWHKESAAQVVELNKLQAKLQRYQFSVIGVFTDKDGRTAVRNFVQKNPVNFPVYYNGDEIVAAFGGVRRLPTTYILLREGSIYAKEAGFRTMRQLEVFTKRINVQRL